MVELTLGPQPDSQGKEAVQNMVDSVDLVLREMEASLPTIFTQNHRIDRPPLRAYLEAS